MTEARLLWANGVIRGDDTPVVDGAVVVDAAGTVLDVGPAAEVMPRSAGAVVEKVAGVLCPGLVNAHTHLELSALRGQVPGGAGFLPWVERFIGARAELLPEDEAPAIEAAVEELVASGTAAVGDVSNGLGAVGALRRAGLSGCVFHEVFGVDEGTTLPRIEALEEAVAAGPPPWGDLAYAPSPHTLYTTHPAAVRRLLELSRQRGGLASLHLLEHGAERRALEAGEGPVLPWLERRARLAAERAFWPRRPVLDYAAELGVLGPDVLLVHLTVARADELARIAEAGAPVVLCPRSNLTIELALPPLLQALAAGLEPALGTDSLASNTSLDVLAEARALHDRFPPVPAAQLLAMATWNGARALRRPDLGRVRRGARPGLFVVPGAPTGDPAAHVLTHCKAPRTWLVPRRPKASRPPALTLVPS